MPLTIPYPVIILGYTKITADFSTALTAATQITGLTTTFTVPAGVKNIEVEAFVNRLFNNTANNHCVLSIWDGTVGSGTLINATYATSATASAQAPGFVKGVIVAPATGSKTINISLHVSGTGTATATASLGGGFVIAKVA